MKYASIDQLQSWDAFMQKDGPELSTDLLESILTSLAIPFELITQQQVATLLQPRKPFSHKGTHGHALLVAGSEGKMGAALLAAKACLRSGVGLLTLAIPPASASIVHTALPEAMVLDRTEWAVEWRIFKAMGIGSGIGTDASVQALVGEILQDARLPIVLDADALNIIAANRGWLLQIPHGCILSPHPKEFDRLFGPSENDFERWQKALAASLQYECVVIVKGHFTLIASNGKAWFNSSTGNAGMAKGGTGDMLTGMLTAFLAQEYLPEHAAILAVYLHGLAADVALQNQSMESLLASDMIESLGAGFKKISTGS
ncbi:MAG: NAD(P)H-hydrate dehydratase [Sediminibacterium sp.]|nr:NAD(P)H-hydrate dehydratase [Sediminibacterium sp.]TXT34844.1 MAG: hypothetical protein FD136_55 [Chitinophagaceae bacterium]